jgi:hypothetical protein
MLRSSGYCFLKLERTPESSELEYRQKQQLKLLAICRRTLAVPVGRGMLTIGTTEPLMAEALPIPPISLNGRVPPNNSVVALDLSSAHVDLKLWPEFHNGVAAALRIGPAEMKENTANTRKSKSSSSRRVTRNWIIYNKTAAQSKASALPPTTPGGSSAADNGHAGFLLGMGLFGHLNVLTITDICDYITQGHEPTTIAILLGVAASKMGTANAILSKTLCLHLPALLPAQHWDIEISPLTQCAALIGLGFLYCRSGHRLMVQFLLEEMSRKPTSDRCECREALALSAAWSLAMVLLPKTILDGRRQTEADRKPETPFSPAANSPRQEEEQQEIDGDPMNMSPTFSFISQPPSTAKFPIHNQPEENELLKSVADLKIEDRLFLLINGGSRPSEFSLFPGHNNNQHHAQSGDNSARSSRILEGEQINRDITSPGATLALSLIYIGSNNAKILKLLDLPTTMVELDSIRPDLLIYRCLGRSLIQWNEVSPTEEWIQQQMPAVVNKVLYSSSSSTGQNPLDTSSAATNPAEKKAPPKYVGPYGKARHCQYELSNATAFVLQMNITCGYCLGMAMVYAGTFNEQAKITILNKLKWLQG